MKLKTLLITMCIGAISHSLISAPANSPAQAQQPSPADDQTKFGRVVHNLSYSEVREILESDAIYAGRMAPENFSDNGIISTNHPYSLITQLNCIINSKTTEPEKAALWSLFVSRNFFHATLIFNEYNVIKEEKLTLPTTPPLKRPLLDRIGIALGTVVVGFLSGVVLSHIVTENMIPRGEIAQDTREGCWAIGGFVGIGGLHYLRLKRDGRNHTKRLQQVFKLHEALITKISSVLTAPEYKLPEKLVAQFHELRNSLEAINNKNIFSLGKHKEYQAALVNYYEDLQAQSDSV